MVIVFIALLFAGSVPQPDKSAAPSLDPYPGSTKFCSEHVAGARGATGKPGPHINWTGYFSTDPPEKVVSHYMRLLGSTNHAKEGDQDVWRFPLDVPERVLSVTHEKGVFPRGQCSPPPPSARAIVIVSMTTRPPEREWREWIETDRGFWLQNPLFSRGNGKETR